MSMEGYFTKHGDGSSCLVKLQTSHRWDFWMFISLKVGQVKKHPTKGPAVDRCNTLLSKVFLGHIFWHRNLGNFDTWLWSMQHWKDKKEHDIYLYLNMYVYRICLSCLSMPIYVYLCLSISISLSLYFSFCISVYPCIHPSSIFIHLPIWLYLNKTNIF